jgi:hypothetical protein
MGTKVSMRINKTTTIGAVATCAVIGATSPVWADSGSGTSAQPTAQQAAVINALKAEIAKLETQLQSDQTALHTALSAVQAQRHALTKARVEAAHLRAHHTHTLTVTPPVAPAPAFNRDQADNQGDQNESDQLDSRDNGDTEDQFGDNQDERGYQGDPYGGRGDYGNHDNQGENNDSQGGYDGGHGDGGGDGNWNG